MQEPSLIYNILLTKAKRRARIVLWVCRDESFKVQLGYYDSAPNASLTSDQVLDGAIKMLSTKPVPFLDADDLTKLKSLCDEFTLLDMKEFPAGSIIVKLLQTRDGITLLCEGDIVIAKWSAVLGLRFEPEAHPALKKDKAYISAECAELPRAGIFSNARTHEEGILPKLDS